MDSSLMDFYHGLVYRDRDWQEAALEKVQLLIYSGMEVFIIFMTVFFFLFVYYCAFGFVVGAIAESNIEGKATKLEDRPQSSGTAETKVEAKNAKPDAKDMGFGLFD